MNPISTENIETANQPPSACAYFDLTITPPKFSAQTVLEASLNHFKEESASITAALSQGLQRYKAEALAQAKLKA